MGCCNSCDSGGPCDCGNPNCQGGCKGEVGRMLPGELAKHQRYDRYAINGSDVGGYDVGATPAGAGSYAGDCRGLQLLIGDQVTVCNPGFDWATMLSNIPFHIGNWVTVPDLAGSGSLILDVLPNGMVVPNKIAINLVSQMYPDFDLQSYLAGVPNLDDPQAVVNGIMSELKMIPDFFRNGVPTGQASMNVDSYWGQGGGSTMTEAFQFYLNAYGYRANGSDFTFNKGFIPVYTNRNGLLRARIKYVAVPGYVDDATGAPLLFAQNLMDLVNTPFDFGLSQGSGSQTPVFPRAVFVCPDGSLFGYAGPPTADGQDVSGYAPVPNPNYDPSQPASPSNPPYIPGGPAPTQSTGTGYPGYPPGYPTSDPSIDPLTGVPYAYEGAGAGYGGYGYPQYQQPYYPQVPQYPYLDPSMMYQQPMMPPMLPQLPFMSPMQQGGFMPQMPGGGLISNVMDTAQQVIADPLGSVQSILSDPMALVQNLLASLPLPDLTQVMQQLPIQVPDVSNLQPMELVNEILSSGIDPMQIIGMLGIDPSQLLMHEQSPYGYGGNQFYAPSDGVSGVGAALPPRMATSVKTSVAPKTTAGKGLLSTVKNVFGRKGKVDTRSKPVLWRRMAKAARLVQLRRYKAGSNSHAPAPDYKNAVAKKAAQVLTTGKASSPVAKANLASHLAAVGHIQTSTALAAKVNPSTLSKAFAVNRVNPSTANAIMNSAATKSMSLRVPARSFGVSGGFDEEQPGPWYVGVGDYANAGDPSTYGGGMAYGYQTPTPNMFAPVNDEGYEVDPYTGEVLPPF